MKLDNDLQLEALSYPVFQTLQFTLTPDFSYTYNDFGVNCNN